MWSGIGEHDLAAMGAHQFAGDAEAEARAAGPTTYGERLEQLGDHVIRHAGPVVADADQQKGAAVLRLDGDRAGAGIEGIAAEIGEYAVQQVTVGADAPLTVQRIGPVAHHVGIGVLGLLLQRHAHLIDQVGQVEFAEPRRRSVAHILDGVAGEPCGAVDGVHDGGSELARALVVAACQAVGQQPRRRQDVAQVVVDLVGSSADLGEAALLA